MLIKPEDVPGLLAKVANLISERAARRCSAKCATLPAKPAYSYA